jgi:hypothetical protein
MGVLRCVSVRFAENGGEFTCRSGHLEARKQRSYAAGKPQMVAWLPSIRLHSRFLAGGFLIS